MSLNHMLCLLSRLDISTDVHQTLNNSNFRLKSISGEDGARTHTGQLPPVSFSKRVRQTNIRLLSMTGRVFTKPHPRKRNAEDKGFEPLHVLPPLCFQDSAITRLWQSSLLWSRRDSNPQSPKAPDLQSGCFTNLPTSPITLSTPSEIRTHNP